MKLSTDSVLLGAWTKTENAEAAIDIGTGCGVLALMLAQKGIKKISAVESDMHAAMQASGNFNSSPWPQKFECICVDVHAIAKDLRQHFDLIISNPPYFQGQVPSPSEERNKARHANGEPAQFRATWFESAYILGNDKSELNLIFPFTDEADWLESAGKAGWYIKRICRVRGKEKTEYSRTLACFSKMLTELPVEETLTIETEIRGIYTEAYRKLTKDFYLERVFNR
ncbi:MAG: methyltransferase [Bacteroidia bacterium]